MMESANRIAIWPRSRSKPGFLRLFGLRQLVIGNISLANWRWNVKVSFSEYSWHSMDSTISKMMDEIEDGTLFKREFPRGFVGRGLLFWGMDSEYS